MKRFHPHDNKSKFIATPDISGDDARELILSRENSSEVVRRYGVAVDGNRLHSGGANREHAVLRL